MRFSVPGFALGPHYGEAPTSQNGGGLAEVIAPANAERLDRHVFGALLDRVREGWQGTHPTGGKVVALQQFRTDCFESRVAWRAGKSRSGPGGACDAAFR